jgi:26S proteasome regulatory subunit N4
MGRPMDEGLADIHVPSGPTTTRYDEASLEGLSLRQLITKKDNLEEELKALGSVLDSHGVNMQTTLTTFDGYPRSDIDVAQIRVTRARIIALRNDWKNMMDKIEKGLHEHHADIQAAASAEKPETTEPSLSSAPAVQRPPSPPETPFAKVNSVEPGSPANEAGLKAGDKIRRFGEAIWSNHANLRKVSEVVQQNTGRPILVKIVREGPAQAQELELRLTPRQGWGGRGSLGCHILPI